MTTVKERIAALRACMKEKGIDAYLIQTDDYHASEYVGEFFKCRAYMTGKLSPTNAWQAARYNIPGLMAHKSAMLGGVALDIPDFGNPPEGWEVLPSEYE